MGAGRRRRLGTTSATAVLLVGLTLGCTGTTEIDLEAERAGRPSENGEVPNWIRAGRVIAERTAARDASGGTGESAQGAEGSDGSEDTDRPSSGSSELTAALTAAGIPSAQARCVSAAVADDPELGADVETVVDALQQGGTAPATLDPALTTRLVGVLGPCFNASAITALVIGGGAGTAAGGGGGLPAPGPAAPGGGGTGAGAPPGVDALLAGLQQLVAGLGSTVATIPDLSQVNPFTLVDRGAFVQGASGLKPAQAGCLYDRLRALTPQQIQQAFGPQPNQSVVQSVITSALGCLVNPG